MQSRDEILTLLINIKDKINQQIPLATNRFEEHECVPHHANIKEVNQNYLEHDKRYTKAHIDYSIYKHINDALSDYLVETKLKDPKQFSARQDEEAKKRLISKAVQINKTLERNIRILGTPDNSDSALANLNYVKDFLEQNAEKLIATWKKTQHLEIENPDFEKRFQLDDVLMDYREKCARQFIFNKQKVEDFDQSQTEAKQNREKAHHFWFGIYFEQIQSTVGYCDEHTCIGLKKIFEDLHLYRLNTIEKVDYICFDENGKPDYGHTFLAINRSPESSLNLPTTWGKDAILFDPWNKLVCFAEELDIQPLKYLSYPKKAKWESLKFDWFDNFLLKSLLSMNDYYAIAGNEEVNDRTLRLIEEFQLTPIMAKEVTGLGRMLSGMAKEVWPEQLQMDVKFFVTTQGNQLLTTLPGFAEPALIIHRDFLLGDNTNFSIEGLRFALARELLYIQHYGAGLTNAIPADDEYRLDKLAIEKTGLGHAAIHYLQQFIAFEKENPGAIKVPVLRKNIFLNEVTATTEQRIKAIVALIAKQQDLAGSTMKTGLAGELGEEAAKLGSKTFYSKEWNSNWNKLDKLRYLQNQLPDLYVELLPYEFSLKLSIRGREFCELLRGLKLNLTCQDELNAIHEFINTAFKLQVPAFIELYYAVCGLHCNRSKRDQPLPALGIFHEFQQVINDFVQVSDDSLAKSAALKLRKILGQLQHHFVKGLIENPIASHYEKYKKNHNGAIPTGTSRYFGSWIGTVIKWSGFTKISDQGLPWDQHVIWAKQDLDGDIRQMLWFLGVRHDSRLWDAFSSLDILNDNENGYIPLPVELGGKGVDDYSYESSYCNGLIKQLSCQHKLQQDMWQENNSFEQAFIQFYDLNLPMLVSPSVKFQRNLDNEAIHSLLYHFAKTAGEDAEKDKVIKSFFLGREDKRDLIHLTYYIMKEAHNSIIVHNLFYTSFVLEQEYNGQRFKLFDLKEQIKFMNKFVFIYDDIDLMRIVKLFNLPFHELNNECLKAVIPLINQNNMQWKLIGRILMAHLEKEGIPDLFSQKGVEIIEFSELALKPEYRKKILEQFVWELSTSEENWNGLGHEDPIKIYHAFDVNLLFPTMAIGQTYGQMVLKKINSIKSLEKRIEAVQSCLFNSDYCLIDWHDNKYYPPMSDIKLRDQLVELLVKDLLTKYDKDDGSKEYAEMFKKVMDEIIQQAPKRDLKPMLKNLMEFIEAQSELSDYVGAVVDLEKYQMATKKAQDGAKTMQLAILVAVAQKISEDPDGQKQLIAFLASPLTEESLTAISHHIATNKNLSDIFKIIGKERTSHVSNEDIKTVMLSIYHEFWSIKLSERAVVMEALLISPDKMANETEQLKAYQDALTYVLQTLFPNAAVDSDENFATAFIHSYLDTAGPYMRSYLMAGLLVASNESQGEAKVSTGRKFALFCESLGPAYVKLAQAIHSYPSTPEHIKADLHHIKGRANPPYRWDLWRLIDEVLSEQDRSKIKRIGKLLGSASYNLALEAELVSGDNVVLLLLRENAEKDAKNGFKHLKKTLLKCSHPRIEPIRDTGVSILEQAEDSSNVEMNHELSKQQAEIALKIYQKQITIKIGEQHYVVNMVPSTIICSGKGYRFLTRMYGPEFNDLPDNSLFYRKLKQEIAKIVITVELTNILSGSYFDSDRHGNQMRVHVNNSQITLGLYDFGEMALEQPSDDEIKLMAKVIKDMPEALKKWQAFDKAMDEVLSRRIEEAMKNKSSVTYLTRARKAVLALQDFQGVLSNNDLFDILKEVSKSEMLAPVISKQLKESVDQMAVMLQLHSFTESIADMFSFFGSTSSKPEIKQSTKTVNNTMGS